MNDYITRLYMKRKQLRIAIRVTWSAIALIGGSYVLDITLRTYPKYAEFWMLPYLFGILALLYAGHLLLNKIMFKQGKPK
jgi:hypothetical protein